MALTHGTGPFGVNPAGRFNFTYDAPDHVLYFEDSPRRIRVVVAGEIVAETTHAKLLHETGHAPVYYVPEQDARAELLTASEHITHCPYKGEASYRSIQVGDDVRLNAVWSYPQPLAGAPELAGYLAFMWNAVDEWWEEAERIDGHPRDPYHRCDVVRSDRHVVVRFRGQTVAESHRPTMLFETGLPARFYLPEEDVRTDLLEPSGTATRCPYKGPTSRYHHIAAGDDRLEDAAWVYDHPFPEVQGIAGLIAFYTEKLEVEVDGAAL